MVPHMLKAHYNMNIINEVLNNCTCMYNGVHALLEYLHISAWTVNLNACVYIIQHRKYYIIIIMNDSSSMHGKEIVYITTTLLLIIWKPWFK